MPASNPVKSCPGCSDAAIRATLTFEQQCTPCRKKERHRSWREANPGVMAANAKKWREAGNKSERTPEYYSRQNERRRKLYATDPEIREKVKAAAKTQRERLGKAARNAQSKAWRDANPGKTREYYLKGLAKLTPEERQARGTQHREKYKFQRQAGMAAYYARRYNEKAGEVTNEHLVALHKWQDHCCFYCRRGLNQQETIEHVVPLSRGGSNTNRNVVLACSDCNSRKSDRLYAIEWVPERVEAAPCWHSLYATKLVCKALHEQSIPYTLKENHILAGERPVFMLSSFWLGWAGIKPIQSIKERYPSSVIFFDKEFFRRPDAIVNVIKAKAGVAQRIGARKLRLETPTSPEAQAFIGKWHAMGPIGGLTYLGLRDDSDWWVIAAFSKEEGKRYEVARMAIRETVAGGVSRIITHFLANAEEKLPLVAFTDQRHGDGKSHFFAGFEHTGETKHSFFYATPEVNGFLPRRSAQKQYLEQKAEYFDPDQPQPMLAKANGFMRVEGLPRLAYTLTP